MKSKVYFTNEISSEKLVEIYKKLGVELNGKVAVKVHSGEKCNQNYLKPLFYKNTIDYVYGTVVECNTAYDGARNTSDKHLKSNYVGKNIENYDSMLVLSHFKGHPMCVFWGSLKNISIGLASSHGKANIHGAGKPEEIWTADHDSFLESMANMSVDCDCCAKAEDPCMKDIGILSSTDPVALDQACIDLVYISNDPGKDHLIERIESRNGIHTIEEAEKLYVGTRNYELIKF